MFRTLSQIVVGGLIAAVVAIVLRPSSIKPSTASPPTRADAKLSPQKITPPPTTSPTLLIRLPAHEFKEEKLEAVMAWVQSAAGVPVDLHWDKIDAIDSTNIRDRRYTLSLPEGTLESAMDAVLFDDVLGGVLDWKLDHGRIAVSTAADNSSQERYDISGWPGNPATTLPSATPSKPWRSDSGVLAAINEIDPYSWHGSGPMLEPVHVINGIVIVTARSRTQTKVRALLYGFQQAADLDRAGR